MKRIGYGAITFFLVAATSCGSDSDGTDVANDRGGPDSLVGYQWTSDPMTVHGIEFLFGFSFSRTHVTAKNTCNGKISATVQAPIRYLYTATIPTGGRKDEATGGNTCFVEIAAGTFNFEILSNKLVVTYQGETIEFSPVGTVAGLYGKWTAEAPGVGTLTWSMGGGKIVATSDCINGVSATVKVNADFVNKIEFTESAENVVDDGEGLECSVAVAAGVSTYRFDGDALVMTTNGKDIHFSPN